MGSSKEPGRAALPPHLARAMASAGGVDPFAAPATPVAPRRPVSGPVPVGSSAFAPGDESGVMFACPCSCECGKDTTVAASKVTSAAAARMLRCPACIRAGHLGLAAKKDTAPVADGAARKRPKPQVRVVSVYDEDDAELDRMAAREALAMRWAEATAKFEKSLPEKFRRPLDPVQEQAVEDRLKRLEDPQGRGDHQLSLHTYGPYGSGKTWVGYSYLRCAVERRLVWPSEIVHGTEAEIMEPLVFAARWEIADRMKKFLNPRMKMLLIDDVGNMGRWPDVETRHATYASVVNWCWENNRALIMTTNLDLGPGESLERWIGVAAYERWRNMIGRDPVFRVGNKRAELTAKWEAEYQEHLANADA